MRRRLSRCKFLQQHPLLLSFCGRVFIRLCRLYFLRVIGVAWNNSFRHIFRSCWRESVKPLQYLCQLLPMSYLIDQRRMLFWQKMMLNDNIVLFTLSRLIMAVGNRYGITSFSIAPHAIRLKICDSFASSLTDSLEAVHS